MSTAHGTRNMLDVVRKNIFAMKRRLLCSCYRCLISNFLFKLPIEAELRGFFDGVHWYFILLMMVAVIFSGVGLFVGIFYCNTERAKAQFNRALGPILNVHFIAYVFKQLLILLLFLLSFLGCF